MNPPRPIWIDLDNTPHVPFFAPLIQGLREAGIPVVISARDAFQVDDLARQHHLDYTLIGKHSGKNKVRKIFGLFYRAYQLMGFARKHRPSLALSHGSRSMQICATFLRIPKVLIADYEHGKHLPFFGPDWLIVPEAIPNSKLSHPPARVVKYPGIKEDAYAFTLRPDRNMPRELGIDPAEIIVTVRPPATEAHYHNPEAEGLLVRFMDRACKTPGIRLILLPRNKAQADVLKTANPHWFEKQRTIIPGKALNGLSLLWNSDLVVSGGGTMNREAAALGVPVYSIFRGPAASVDDDLEKQGRLVRISSLEETDRLIRLERRTRSTSQSDSPSDTYKKLFQYVTNLYHGCPPG